MNYQPDQQNPGPKASPPYEYPSQPMIQYPPMPPQGYAQPQGYPQSTMPPMQGYPQWQPVPGQYPGYPMQQPGPYPQQQYYQPPMMPPQVVVNNQINTNVGTAGPRHSTAVRLVYFVFIGWWLGLFWLGTALFLCCTIIGLAGGVLMLAKTGKVFFLD